MRARRVIAALIVLGVGCGIAVRLVAQAPLRLRPYASGFTNPLAFVQDPANRAVQFVVEQGGRIRVVRDGVVSDTDFLDLRGAVVAGGEQGLLGLAFSPDASSPRFFVNFTDRSGNTVVARFRRSANNPLVADPASRFDLRWSTGLAFIRQPFANHNGGHLAFGPDGFLYIGLGDGGSGDDPDHRAQNPAELLGKMLRIDVSVADSHPTGYDVPSDNPFVNTPGTQREIWDFGLRNPWRYTFDDPSRGVRARSSSATSGRIASKRSTTNRGAVADATTVGAIARGRTTTSRRGPRPSRRSSIRSSNTITASARRSPAATSFAERVSAGTTRPLFLR